MIAAWHREIVSAPAGANTTGANTYIPCTGFVHKRWACYGLALPRGGVRNGSCIRKIFPWETNETYQRGPKLEVDFRHPNFFLARPRPLGKGKSRGLEVGQRHGGLSHRATQGPVQATHNTGTGTQARQARGVLKMKKFLKGSFAKRPRAVICSTMVGGDWRLAVGGDWRLAVGDWRLVAVGGGWRRLVVGDWWLVAVGNGWRLAAVGGWWLRAVGSWWRLVNGGSWSLGAVLKGSP